jgi:lipopolysaccharide assembly outer membrane protein LptD (OstA)
MFRSTIAVLLLIASASANAQGFDYNYLQLEYTNIELDDISVDGDGFGLSGSYAINPDWHVFAGYQSAGLDFGVDATFLAAGIGYNTELSPVVDAYARLSYQYVDLDAPGVGSFDDNGLGFDVGLRFAASQDLELNAGIDYVDFGDGGDDTGFYAGALWKFTDAFALGLGGSWGDDVSAYTLSGRVYFGK